MSFYGRNVEEIYQAARLCGPTIALTVLSVSIVHPFNGSTFGGIQPNSLAKACLVGFSFAFLEHKRRFRLPLQLFFIAVIVLLTSRASGIVLVATTIAVWFFGYARAIGRVHLPLIAVATIAFFVVLAFMFYATGNLAVELDANNQKDRNVQNRFDAWDLALEQIEFSPLIGYGFRTRANYRLDGIYEPRASVNAHNGYLNFVLDSGFIGLALLTVFWTTEIAKNVLQILRYQLDRTGTRLLSVYTAILVATTLMWLSEPITFNFGNFWSLAFAIALFGSLPIREAVRKRGKRYA
ncbi:O-antigen ligase family protein [Rhodopirellula europaea]|nr:O-antigen ligase family protein [Rhodopirellula europaea]